MLAVILGAASGAASAVEVLPTEFAERWVAPNDPIRLKLDRPLQPNEGALAIFIGHRDVTVLFRQTAPGEFTYTPDRIALPSGEHELIVYQVRAGDRREIARLSLKVLTPAGFETSTVTPRMDLNVKSQLDEEHSEDAPTPERSTYNDLAGQGGLTTEHQRGDLRIASAFNLVGSSYRKEALRFGQEGADAPKVDLTDYRFDVSKGSTAVALGHISYGNNPLLLSNVANRGVMLTQRFGSHVDVSLSSMNGNSIVGPDNFFGLDDAENRINGATLGLEAIADRPGGLRAEVSYVEASVKSLPDFNAGEIPDAEESHGAGLRLLGSTSDGRLRGDFVRAASTYLNPNDPLLAQGDTLVPVNRSRDYGRMADLSYDLLRANTTFSERHPLTVTLSAHHALVDPLYKSLGTFVASDQDLTRYGLSVQIGALLAQAGASRKKDNVEDVPTILKTRTDDTTFNVNAPLGALVGSDSGFGSAWPTLTYTRQRTHQLAINTPTFADSGFQDTHRPDQLNVMRQWGANWNWGRFSLGYTRSNSLQDNRQAGREQADFRSTGHQGTAGLRASDTLNLNLGVNATRNHSDEQELTTRTEGATFGFDWQFVERWTLNGNYGATRTEDSQNLATSDSYTAQTQVAWRFEVPGYGGRKLPGQLFLRHSVQSNSNRDNTFGLATDVRHWTVNAGLSLSLF